MDLYITGKMEIFSAFWCSLCPRIGEDKAEGWDIWVDKKGDVKESSMTNLCEFGKSLFYYNEKKVTKKNMLTFS